MNSECRAVLRRVKMMHFAETDTPFQQGFNDWVLTGSHTVGAGGGEREEKKEKIIVTQLTAASHLHELPLLQLFFSFLTYLHLICARSHFSAHRHSLSQSRLSRELYSALDFFSGLSDPHGLLCSRLGSNCGMHSNCRKKAFELLWGKKKILSLTYKPD